MLFAGEKPPFPSVVQSKPPAFCCVPKSETLSPRQASKSGPAFGIPGGMTVTSRVSVVVQLKLFVTAIVY